MWRVLVDRTCNSVPFHDTLRSGYERLSEVSSKVHFLHTGMCCVCDNMDTCDAFPHRKLEKCDVSFHEDSIRRKGPRSNETERR